MPRRGGLITFEGIEGSGKTTQIALLVEAFRQRDIDFVLTREPGGTPLGEEIRRLLLRKGEWSVRESAELFLYLSDRAQHVHEIILPALKKGKIVLSDRFSDATVAYQGYARGLPIESISDGNRIASQGVRPALTFLFDLPVDLGLKRVQRRSGEGRDRLEAESLLFHKKVRQGYLEIAKEEPERFCRIDATAAIEAIHEQVWRRTEPFLKERGWLSSI